MEEPKRRGGRPRRKPKPGERVPLGLRVTPEMKQRLDDASWKSGRSQSQEAEMRLEQSFQREDLLGDALRLAFGSELAGLVLLMARTMHWAGQVAHPAFVAPLGSVEGIPEDWPNNALAYDQAVQAVTAILEAARPAGDPRARAVDEHDPSLSELGMRAAVKINEAQRDAGRAVAERMLNMVSVTVRGSHNWQLEIETIRKLLGPIVERLAAPAEEGGDDAR